MFCDIYQYITDGKLPSSAKAQNCIRAEALSYIVINHFLFRIDMQKDKDLDKFNSCLLVIPEKYEPIIFNTYHDSLLAGHQGPYCTVMIISANCLFSFSLFWLFAGFLVPLCPKRALVLGNGCERFCTSRSLLGSYTHQKSI